MGTLPTLPQTYIPANFKPVPAPVMTATTPLPTNLAPVVVNQPISPVQVTPLTQTITTPVSKQASQIASPNLPAASLKSFGMQTPNHITTQTS